MMKREHWRRMVFSVFGGLALGLLLLLVLRGGAVALRCRVDPLAANHAPQAVTVDGPGVGTSGVPYTFTAAVMPVTTTMPLTYVWTATTQTPMTHVRVGCTDTVAFTWVTSGVKTITITTSNAEGVVSNTRRIFIDPQCQVYAPLVLHGYPPGPGIHYFRANVEVADPGDSIVLEWASWGATTTTLYHLLPSGQFGSFWDVEATGSMEYDIPAATRNYERFALYASDAQAHHEWASLAITLTCPDTWFFEPAPDECPSGPAVITAGAEEHFEHGTLLWVQAEDHIYVLYADGGSPDWRAFVDEWEPGDPVSDPSLVPPSGYDQPVRGFGLVWREQPGVRDRLGWAVDPEQGYESAIQRTSRWKYNDTYIKALDGGTWKLYPEGSEWEYLSLP